MGNVLVMMADEFSPRFMGCAGHAFAQTPHLDRLAAQGTRFTNAYTPSPICVPARASFATGRWVHRLGAWDSAQPYRGETPGWAHAARDAGYTTASIGKLHYGAAEEDHGFGQEILPMHVVNGVGWVQGLDRRASATYVEAHEFAADVGVGESSYVGYDQEITASTADWLTAHADDDSPWVLFVSFVSPHYPLTVPQQYWDRYDDHMECEIPPIDESHPHLDFTKSFFNYHEGFRGGPGAAAWRDGRRAYLALCSFLDDQVGAVLSALDATGGRADTDIIFTSDHGDMAGNRGLWAKSYMYEDSVGVPLIASGPSWVSGDEIATPVSLVDIHPTVLELTGSDIDEASDGSSLIGLAASDVDDRAVFAEYHDGGSLAAFFMIRTRDWKLVHYVGARPQLFNLRDDPNELVDLAGDAQFGQTLSELDGILRTIVDPDAVNDRAFVDQRALIDRLGGYDKLSTAFRFNHTPVPTT